MKILEWDEQLQTNKRKTGVTVPIIAQHQVSLAMYYGISGVLIFALRVVGLGSVLIACRKTLNILIYRRTQLPRLETQLLPIRIIALRMRKNKNQLSPFYYRL